MTLDRTRSQGPAHVIDLANALVAYVQISEIDSYHEARVMTLRRFFSELWPGMHCQIERKFLHIVPFRDSSTSLFVLL